MEETIETISRWADETFGPSTPQATLDRAIVEIKELLWLAESYSAPDIAINEEAADVIITLYRYLYLTDPEAINKKMIKNRSRKWKITGTGVGQHHD